MSDTIAAKKLPRRKEATPQRGPLLAHLVELEELTDKIHWIAEDRLMERIIELEAMADFYAWGPSPKGELEPLTGEAYVKAMAKDGGKIARAYLRGRIDRAWYGAPNKDAPGGWGMVGISRERPAVSAEAPRSRAKGKAP